MNHDKIKQLLASEPAWVDADGNSLLHYAAVLGDAEIVNACLDGGVDPRVCNNDHLNARDLARIWGHDAIGSMIDAKMKSVPAEMIGHASLDSIRKAGAFHDLAARGLFDQVIGLALKDPVGFQAADLLDNDRNGDSVLFKVCQQGQLPLLMNKDLWLKNLSTFYTVWEKVLPVHQRSVDIKAFLVDISSKMPVNPRPKWRNAP